MNATPPSNPTDAPTPPPFRAYRWPLRLLIIALAWIVLLIAVRFIFNTYAEHRVNQLIADLRNAGQPVLIEDFEVPYVPDDENGALLILQAEQAITQTKQESEILATVAGPLDDFAQHQDAIAQFLARNQATLDLAYRAVQCPHADWQLQLKSPLVNLAFPGGGAHRQLCLLLQINTVLLHTVDRNDEAVKSLHAMLMLGRHLTAPPTLLIKYLIRLATDALTTLAIERIAPHLRICGPYDPSDGCVPRAQVELLIARLLDDDLDRSAQRAFYFERLYLYDGCVSLADGRLPLLGRGTATPLEVAATYLLRPAWILDGARIMEEVSESAAAMTAESWSEADQQFPTPVNPRTLPLPVQVGRIPSSILQPHLRQVLQSHLDQRAENRMAALALAIRLYEHDHGQRPDTLNVLVPDYLAALPRDPFNPHPETLGYLPDDPYPRLYSFGRDGDDDGGKFGWSRDRVDERSDDNPFFLDGLRPKPPRPPETGGDPIQLPAPASTSQAADEYRPVKHGQREQ